jgi:hypothetical protein
VQNVADTNSHPTQARPSSALAGIDSNSFHQVLHTCVPTMRSTDREVKV